MGSNRGGLVQVIILDSRGNFNSYYYTEYDDYKFLENYIVLDEFDDDFDLYLFKEYFYFQNLIYLNNIKKKEFYIKKFLKSNLRELDFIKLNYIEKTKLPIKIINNNDNITFYQKIRDIDRNNINLTINNLRNNDTTVYKNWSYKIENNDGYIDLTLDDLLDMQLKVENKYNQILKIHSYLKNKINKLEYEELKTFDCKNEFDNLMNKNLSYIDNLLRNEGNNE